MCGPSGLNGITMGPGCKDPNAPQCYVTFIFTVLITVFVVIVFSIAPQPLGGLGRLIYRGFTITHFRHTTVGRTPLDE
jgi:hypothetical protein